MRPGSRSALAAAALALLGLGCASSLDIERARKLLDRPAAPATPVLVESPAAALPPVEDLHAVSGELRQVPLRWSPLLTGDVGGYAVERGTAEAGPFQRVATLADRFTTTYDDQGADLGDKAGAPAATGDLGDGQTYFYRVRAYDGSGHLGPPSQDANATTAQPPPPPDGLQAYSQLPRRVALAWDPSSDPTVAGYVVSRSPSPGGEFLPVGKVQGRFRTTWVDRGLGDLRVFYYRVAAVNADGGEGAPSDTRRAVTKPEPLPPTGVGVAERALGRNVVHWEPNVEPDLVAYRVLRLREGAKAPELVGKVDADTPQVEDDAVGAGEKVSYQVVAIDRDGLESAPSDPVQVESVGYGLEADAHDQKVELHWNAALQHQLKAMRVMQVGTLSDSEVGRVTEPRFVQPASPGSHLRFRLIGIRPDGSEGPPSPVLEVEVPG